MPLPRVERLALACAAVISLTVLLPAGHAHTLPISFLRLQPAADYLHAELVLNPFELSFFSELDQNRDGRIDEAELRVCESALTRRITEAIRLNVGGKPASAEVAGITCDPENHHLSLRMHYRVDARHAPVRIESTLGTLTSGSHVTHVTFAAETPQRARLDMQSTSAAFGIEAEPAGAPDTLNNAAIAPLVIVLLISLPCMAVFVLFPLLLRRQRLRSQDGPTVLN